MIPQMKNKTKIIYSMYPMLSLWKLFSVFTLALVIVSFSQPSYGFAQKNNQPKVIQLEEIKIEGRVQKPNAFYILNRSNLGYEVLELRTSFLPKIVKSTQKKPF